MRAFRASRALRRAVVGDRGPPDAPGDLEATTMAKRSINSRPADGRQVDDVMVMAAAGFRHRGVYVRTGETVYMTKAEARDLKALHMIAPLEALDEVPNV